PPGAPGAPAPGGPGGGGAPPAGGGDAALDGNAIRLLNLQSGQIIGPLAGHQDRVRTMSISADGKWVLSSGADEVVILWDVAQGKAKKASPKQPTHVFDAALAPDAKRGALLSAAVFVKFNPETFDPMSPHRYFTAKLAGQAGAQQTDALRTVALTVDGKAVIGGLGGKPFTLDMPEKSKAATPKPLAGHEEAVLCAVVDSSGRAATGGGGTLKAGAMQSGRDNTVRLWELTNNTMMWKGDGHTDSVLCLAFSSDSS